MYVPRMRCSCETFWGAEIMMSDLCWYCVLQHGSPNRKSQHFNRNFIPCFTVSFTMKFNGYESIILGIHLSTLDLLSNICLFINFRAKIVEKWFIIIPSDRFEMLIYIPTSVRQIHLINETSLIKWCSEDFLNLGPRVTVSS